jgi:hypothetical protein
VELSIRRVGLQVILFKSEEEQREIKRWNGNEKEVKGNNTSLYHPPLYFLIPSPIGYDMRKKACSLMLRMMRGPCSTLGGI